jgi:hypothetical protein
VTALRIEALQRTHTIEQFDCGREALNRFLIRYALQNQQAGASRTWVALAGKEDKVVGYYTLVVGQVEYDEAPACSKTLCCALFRLPRSQGIRAFAVHAKDDDARSFYERFDFIPSPTDPYHCFVCSKTFGPR